MPNINETMRTLLATAAQRSDYSLFPLPACLKPGTIVTKATAKLLSLNFAVDRDPRSALSNCRNNGSRELGLFATDAGLASIGIDTNADQGNGGSADGAQSLAAQVPAEAAANLASARAGTGKKALAIELLRRTEGATLADMVMATGWLPHTARAALSGLRKAGHMIERNQHANGSSYRIRAAQ